MQHSAGKIGKILPKFHKWRLIGPQLGLLGKVKFGNILENEQFVLPAIRHMFWSKIPRFPSKFSFWFLSFPDKLRIVHCLRVLRTFAVLTFSHSFKSESWKWFLRHEMQMKSLWFQTLFCFFIAKESDERRWHTTHAQANFFRPPETLRNYRSSRLMNSMLVFVYSSPLIK